MRQMLIAAVLFMALAGTAVANSDPPPFRTVEVTCQCECNCDKTELPGLFKVKVRDEIRCGTITVISNGFFIDQGDGLPDFFMSNAWKRARQVETCE